jgi:3-dehydrotetronate 4-kinase
MLLGCIADDFTGATDLANMLVRGGMRTIQIIGIPATPLDRQVDAVVVALKSRTIPASDAVAQSLTALEWLKAAGAKQIYFKYCSTFDSTPKGNIGPVTDALMHALGTDFTIACPAFPEAGRTICRGYLFVGDVLLSESGMKDHPLTPMTDANLVRVLQAQTKRKVGLIRYDTLTQGPAVLSERIAALRKEGVDIAIADALSEADLVALAEGCADLPLVTAGSGVGLGIALNHARAGRLGHAATAAVLPRVPGCRRCCRAAARSRPMARWRTGRNRGRPSASIRCGSRPGRQWPTRLWRGRSRSWVPVPS